MAMSRDRYRRPSYSAKCYQLITVLTVLFCCWFPSCSAYGDVVVTNTSLITDCCIDFCASYQLDKERTNECARGCRIFDALNKASVFVPFDDIRALSACHSSCSEAYETDLMADMACSDGCIQAQQEYHKVYSLSLQWLQDMQSNMTFFETLLEVTGAIVFPPAVGVDAGRFLEHTPGHHNNIKKNHQSKKTKEMKTSVSVTSSSFGVTHQYNLDQRTKESWKENSTKQLTFTVPNWIAQSAFIILTLATIVVTGMCCYCCIFASLIRNSRKGAIIITDDLPPSYDQLIQNGFLVTPNANMMDHTIRIEKKESSAVEIECLLQNPLAESEGTSSQRDQILRQMIVV